MNERKCPGGRWEAPFPPQQLHRLGHTAVSTVSSNVAGDYPGGLSHRSLCCEGQVQPSLCTLTDRPCRSGSELSNFQASRQVKKASCKGSVPLLRLLSTLTSCAPGCSADHPLFRLGRSKSITFKMAMQWDMRPLGRQEERVSADLQSPPPPRPPLLLLT